MLPIFAITGRAVWFVVSNVFTLFRLAWLPIAVLIAADYALAYGVIQQLPGLTAERMAADKNAHLGPLLTTDVYSWALLTEVLLYGLALSVIAVAVHRIILFGDRRPGHYFVFPFGTGEFRYVLMGVLTVLLISLFIASAFFLVLATGAVGLAGVNEMILGGVLLIAYIPFFWLTVRLTVWPPSVVASSRLSPKEAWGLSKGNFWALVALMIASGVTFIAIGGAIAIVASQIGNENQLTLARDMAFGDAFSLEQKVKLLLGAGTTGERVVAELLYRFFVTTYTVAVLSYAYKALKGFDADLPINAQPDFGDDLAPGERPLGAL